MFTLDAVQRLRRTLRNTAFQAGAQGSTSVGRYVTFLLLARMVAASEFEKCAVFLTATVVIGSLCDLGLNIGCLKYSAAARTDLDRLGTQQRFLKYRLLLTLVVAGGVFVASSFIARSVLGHSEYSFALVCASLVGAVSSLTSFTNNALQAGGRFDDAAKAAAMATCFQFAGFTIAMLLQAPGLIGLVAGELTGRSVFLFRHVSLLRKIVTAVSQDSSSSTGIQSILRFTGWVSLSALIGALYNSIPMLAITRLAGDTALSTYAVGAALAGWISLLLNTGMTVLLPEAMAAIDTKARIDYLRTYLPVTLTTAVILIAVVWIAAPVVLTVAGPRYVAATAVFRLLATSQLILLIANPIQFLLYPMNRAGLGAASDAVIVIVFGTLAFALTPEYGIVGPALGLLIGQSAVKGLMAVGIVLSVSRIGPPGEAGMQSTEVLS